MKNSEHADLLLALARLAPNGARALAVDAGVDDQRFQRVLAGRLNMPQDVSEALAKQLAFDVRGFDDCVVMSSICKQIEDLERLEQLGFRWSTVCRVASQRELQGGSPLQRYLICKLIFRSSLRVLIVRMASIKFLQFYEKYRLQDLPVVEVDGGDLGVLNDIRLELNSSAEKGQLTKALKSVSENGDIAGMMELVKRCIVQGAQTSLDKPLRRTRRLTQSVRIADTSSRLQEWDEPARNMSVTHHIYPVSAAFKGLDAIGLRGDDTPVFIDIKTLAGDGVCRISPHARQFCQHLIVFKKSGSDTDPRFELVFDGPMDLVAAACTTPSIDEQKYREEERQIHARKRSEGLDVSIAQLERAKARLGSVRQREKSSIKPRG